VVLTRTTVSFWTEVSSPSFPIAQVPSAIQNEPQEAKNKKVKPHGLILYLTLKKNSNVV
jgi:hypothetical protein